MTRTTVYRFDLLSAPGPQVRLAELGFNVNDSLHLDGFLDYQRTQYLEDLAGDGVFLIDIDGDVHTFSDGSRAILREVEELIDIEKLGPESQALLLLAVCA